jgi:diketogulonate reductase-like aldo/keto reductase
MQVAKCLIQESTAARREYTACLRDCHDFWSTATEVKLCSLPRRVTNATVTWLKSGGRRIDHGDSYEDMVSVGAGIRASGVPRSEMFITTKVGDGGLGLGAKDVNAQFEYYLQQVGISYVDLLLIHWPTSGDNSSTAVCQMHGSSYDATACRIDSWKALLAIMKAGKAKAVGVSNFNTGAFPSMN